MPLVASNYTASAARNPSLAFQFASSGPSELDYSLSENLAASGQLEQRPESNSLAEAFLKRKLQQKPPQEPAEAPKSKPSKTKEELAEIRR